MSRPVAPRSELPVSSFLRSDANMQIFVKNLRGQTITLDVAASDSINDVKHMIQLEEHIPPALQLLRHAGRVLSGCRTLAECNDQPEATLWLSLRCCGGGKKKKFHPRSPAASPSQSPDKAPVSPSAPPPRQKLRPSEPFPSTQPLLVVLVPHPVAWYGPVDGTCAAS